MVVIFHPEVITTLLAPPTR